MIVWIDEDVNEGIAGVFGLRSSEVTRSMF